MAKHADTIFKLSLAVAALIAGLGVGYYYGIVLPARAEREEQRLLAAEQARGEAEAKARKEAARKQEAARTAYQDCLNFADLGYRNRWTAACRGQHLADIAEYQDCLDDLFSTREGCMRAHPVRAERDCNLPEPLARTLAEDRDRNKAQCSAAPPPLSAGASPPLAQ